MGTVDDRGSRPAKRSDGEQLARLTEDGGTSIPVPPDEDDDDIFKEWGIEPVDASAAPPLARTAPVANGRFGIGTTPPHGARASELVPVEVRTRAPSVPFPARSRSATVHDPLTTSVLAEVARRTQAVEVAPVARSVTSVSADDLPAPVPSKTRG